VFNRKLYTEFTKHFFKGYAIVLIGPRQVGKTTLINQIAKESGKNFVYYNCDEPDVKKAFEEATLTQLENLVGNYEMIVMDEVQRVENIGVTLKRLVDNFKNRQFLITGSSALEIADKVFEPLTGRQLLYHLYPLGLNEIYEKKARLEINKNINWHLVYGMYPKPCTEKADAEIILKNLAGQYLYKDVLSWKDIRKPDLLDKILHLLALQIGSEVSLHELAVQLKVNVATIDTYIDLLEKSGVVYRLGAYSTNERKEVVKMKKIYFWDNGIRNAILGRFEPIELRTDVGALWENYIITERIKLNSNLLKNTRSYFWRSKQQQEIDYVEVDGDTLLGYECKFNPLTKGKPTKAFGNLYPTAIVQLLTKENYFEFAGV
jgi:uncharacterized protein